MAASKFTAETRGALIERFAAGCTVTDAAIATDVREKTLKGWLTRGRKEESGDYADFAKAVDEARERARTRPDPMDEAELARVVSESARKGNTQAMKLRWEMLNRRRDPEEPEKPVNPLDELAQRRAARAG